jgi:hypothetical protein
MALFAIQKLPWRLQPSGHELPLKGVIGIELALLATQNPPC